MINIYSVGQKVFVWNAEDIMTLRKEHRIVGSLVGIYPTKPFQVQTKWLPLQLMREEAKLLIDKAIARLLPSPEKITDPELIQSYFNKRDELCKEQAVLLKEKRKKMIIEKAPQILAGKKRKYLQSQTEEDCSSQATDTDSFKIAKCNVVDICSDDMDSEDKLLKVNNKEQLLVSQDAINDYSIKVKCDKMETDVEETDKETDVSATQDKTAGFSSQGSCQDSGVKKDSLSLEDATVCETKYTPEVGTKIGDPEINSNIENETKISVETEKQTEIVSETEKQTEIVSETEKQPGISSETAKEPEIDKQPGINSEIENQSKISSETEKQSGISSEAGKQSEISSAVKNQSATDIENLPEIRAEISKLPEVSKELCAVQLFTESPWKDMSAVATLSYPVTEMQKIRYAVFKDLWEKGFYVTNGMKFGGQFLAYEGDPIKYHAVFIVVCYSPKQNFKALDVLTYGRLGHQVKKTVAYATLAKTGNVEYISVNWADDLSD